MSRLLYRSFDSGGLRPHDRSVSNWVTELVAENGIADFVLTPSTLSGSRLEFAQRLAKCVTTPAAASVVACLNASRSTSVTDIMNRSALSRGVVASIIRRLAASGLAWGNSQTGVRLLRPVKESDIELWAYELKLSDWRHGLYQALQYKAFAHSVSIVLPETAARAVTSNLPRFRAFNVGVLIFNTTTGKLRVLVKPKRSRPGSRGHYLFALAGFVRAISAPRMTSVVSAN
jgi:hypothetical protein